MAHSKDMLKAPLVTLFFSYSIPWTLSMLILSSAGVIDGIFIGHYAGPLALAAVNIVWPIFSLVMGVGIAVASGGGVRCSAYLAKKEYDKAQGMFTNCLFFMLIFGFCTILPCFFFADSIVLFLGADESTLAYAVLYLETVMYFFPILCVGLVLSFFLRVDERPTLAALGYTITALFNMAFDYLFIAHLGWGIRGAALATGIGYSSMIVLYVAVYWSSKTPRRLALVRAFGQWREVFGAMWNGISEMISEMSSGIIIIIMNIAMMRMAGAYGVAAFTVVGYLNWCCLILSFGFADSLSPLISANHAVRAHHRNRGLLYIALVTVGVVGVICFALMSFFPRELVQLFLPDSEGTKASIIAENFMYISRFIFLFCGANIVLTAYLTGLLQALASGTVALLRTLVLPALFVSIFPLLWDYKGVALALPISEGLTLLLAIVLCYRQQKSLKKG